MKYIRMIVLLFTIFIISGCKYSTPIGTSNDPMEISIHMSISELKSSYSNTDDIDIQFKYGQFLTDTEIENFVSSVIYVYVDKYPDGDSVIIYEKVFDIDEFVSSLTYCRELADCDIGFNLSIDFSDFEFEKGVLVYEYVQYANVVLLVDDQYVTEERVYNEALRVFYKITGEKINFSLVPFH
ncbi:MAG: hypothetical protein KQ78_01328 [Candidatus Izimaplasma bacterium HR2]|nr:MAG: hypothetical protein KQ78_01328 [Candidatus Izimaplasma bacterium HR2]